MKWKIEMVSVQSLIRQMYLIPCFNIYCSILKLLFVFLRKTKIVSMYDQDIPQSQTADNPMAPRGRAAQPSRDVRKTN